MKRKWLVLAAFPVILLWMAPPAAATSLGGHNLSLFVPTKQTVAGDHAVFAPLSDYITLNVNDVAQGWVSFHASAYQRVQLGDVLGEDVTRFELTYGYLDLRTVRERLDLRVGRQFVFMGVAREHADSIKVDLKGPAGLKLSAFGGIPVFSDFDTVRGDVTAGGRLSWRFCQDRRTVAEIGISGIHSTQQHDPDRDNVGADLFATVPDGNWLNLSSHVFYDVLYDEIFDVAVLPTVTLGPVFVTFRYNRTEPSAYLSKYSVLSVFSNDVVEEIGGTADLELGYGLGVDASFGYFAYDTGNDSRKAEVNFSAHHGDALQNLVGVGASYTDAGVNWTNANEFASGKAKASFIGVRVFGRQYLYEDYLFADGEIFGYFFDKNVEGKDASVSGSLDLGVELMKHLELLGGFSYEQNPLLDEEIRGTVRLTYSYFGMIGR